MAKITLASIKQQIAALEAKAQRIAADEMKSSVAKVHSLMDSLGVTLEHLGSKLSARASLAKKAVAGKKSASTKRAGAVRYRDPVTGSTWSGLGRAPRWIASAANRDVYLVGKTAPIKTAKETPAAGKKVGIAAKKAAVKVAKSTAVKKASASAKKVAKKPAPIKPAASSARTAAKQGSSQKADINRIASPAPDRMASAAPVDAPASE